MSEEKIVQATSTECQQEFITTYNDKVHFIGRITMAIAFVLSFLPILYLNFVKGYTMPFSDYLLVASTISIVRVGMWISEPFTWYPVLGAASLYIGYLSGNVKNLRVPVAQNLQNEYDLEVNSPRGQIITTIGVGVSVFVNIAILLATVAIGSAVIPMLPSVVTNSFNFVVPSLIGALLCNHIRKRGLPKVLLYSVPSFVVFYLMMHKFVAAKYANSVSIGVTVFITYVIFIIRGKIEERQSCSNRSFQ